MPIVDGLAKQYAGKIELKRVNILDSNNQALMEAYSFSTAPQLFLLDRQANIVASWDEVVSAGDLSKAFDQVLR